MDRHLPLLTNSRAKSFRACPRLHHLTYGLGYRSCMESEALRFGTLIHRGLEAWWRAPLADRLAHALAALQVDADVFERAKAEALILGYDARWGGEQFEVLAVEAEFTAPLVNPASGYPSTTWQMAGKFDVIARDITRGRVVVVEHKSTSDEIGIGSLYWQRLKLDAQISTYLAGAKAIGYEAEACLYDVIGKPSLRPRKATPEADRQYTKPTKKDPGSRLYKNQRETDETPDEYRARILEDIAGWEDNDGELHGGPDKYFQRGEVVRLESEVDDAAFDLWQTARAIREAELANRHPRNSDACIRYGSTCAFFPVCCGEASLDDPTRYQRVENVHQELTEVTRAA